MEIITIQPKIQVRPFRPEDKAQWERFVLSSNNGTMFHRQQFLAYHAPGKFTFHHLLFFRSGQLLSVLPGGIIDEAFWSPVGASYGSFVLPKGIRFERTLQLVDAFLEHLAAEGIDQAYLIPPPLIYHATYSQNLEYALLYRRFGFEYHYISHAIDLRRITGDPLSTFDATARKTIRKILRQQALEIRESTDYDQFYPILLANKARHNAKPTHTLEELYRLQELVPEHLRLLLVYHKGEPIAGSLLFLCNAQVVLCFYNMLRYEYEALRPIYFLMYEIVRWAKQQGYAWVDIGVSQVPQDPDPMTPSLSLIAFKERFGAQGIIRSTYFYCRNTEPKIIR